MPIESCRKRCEGLVAKGNRGGLMRYLFLLVFGMSVIGLFSPLHRPILALLTGQDYPTSWRIFLVLAVPLAAAIWITARHLGMNGLIVPVVSGLVAIAFSIGSIGVTADMQRRAIIAAFDPDRVSQQSIFWSLRNTPRDFQIALHAVMQKDCRFYGWSYRDMAPYLLPPRAVPNVVPTSWIAACNNTAFDL